VGPLAEDGGLERLVVAAELRQEARAHALLQQRDDVSPIDSSSPVDVRRTRSAVSKSSAWNSTHACASSMFFE
jgi:hypothetical protein